MKRTKHEISTEGALLTDLQAKTTRKRHGEKTLSSLFEESRNEGEGGQSGQVELKFCGVGKKPPQIEDGAGPRRIARYGRKGRLATKSA